MLKNAGATITKAIHAETELTGKKFCAHHQGQANVNEGWLVWRGRVRRWICFNCQEKSRSRR